MSRINFKISLIAAGVMAATSSQAALYKVVEIGPASGYEKGFANNVDVTEFYGAAISHNTETSNEKGCFGEVCNSGNYVLAGDTRAGSEGHSYTQEVPFNYDQSFYLTNKNRNKDYCSGQLGYQTCSPGWIDKMWLSYSDHGGLERERDAWLFPEYRSNAQSFINSSMIALGQPSTDYKPNGFSYQNTSSNAVVTAFDAVSGNAIGITSSGYYENGENSALVYRQRGFWGNDNNPIILNPLQTNVSDTYNITKLMGRTMAYGSLLYQGTTYVFGSASVAPFDTDSDKNYRGSVSNCLKDSTISADPAAYADCQNFGFATKAAIWDTTGAMEQINPSMVLNWKNSFDESNIDKKARQGSFRAGVVSDTTNFKNLPVFVGINTTKDGSSNSFLQATVFTPTNQNPSLTNPDDWKSETIARATIKSGDDFVYSNSLATGINKNLVLIGEAKRRGDKRENGAAPNRMFLATVDSDGKASASYFDELNNNNGIFFRGAGGVTGAINNYNEIVGRVDAEQSTEYFGKQRRQRGFIYPYDNLEYGSKQSRLDVFDGKPWLLDDLTNDGKKEGNNQYRVVDATDINDDGIISGTALKCEGGYDTTSHNSYCGNGQKREKVVAVKLIPIANATSADIQTRALEAAPVERKGGSLGWMAMIFLGFLGLRRNK